MQTLLLILSFFGALAFRQTMQAGHLNFLNPYLRQIWMLIALGYTIWGLYAVESFAISAHSAYGGYPVRSYVIVGALGAALFCGYWALISRVIPPRTAPIPATPLNNPAPPQKEVPPSKKKDNRHPLPVRKLQFSEEQVSSKREDAPFAVRVVVQTNVPIQPTSIVLKCNAEVAFSEWNVRGVGALRDVSEGNVGGPKNPWFYFGDPPFKPDTPIIVTLMAKQSIHVVSVEEGPSR